MSLGVSCWFANVEWRCWTGAVARSKKQSLRSQILGQMRCTGKLALSCNFFVWIAICLTLIWLMNGLLMVTFLRYNLCFTGFYCQIRMGLPTILQKYDLIHRIEKFCFKSMICVYAIPFHIGRVGSGSRQNDGISWRQRVDFSRIIFGTKLSILTY